MKKRELKWFSLIILISGVLLIVALLWLTRPLEKSVEDINALNPNHLIAHAGGAIDGYTYTNSREALMNALDNGFRYIELDLYETTDSNVVCLHSLEDYRKMTSIDSKTLDSKSFLSHQLYGKYIPMTLNDAIKIWKERPFFFVTDKISDPKILNRYFKNNRDKVIVEAFTLDDYIQLESDGYIPMYSVLSTDIRGLFRYIMDCIKCGRLLSRIVVDCYAERYVLRICKRLGVKLIAMYFHYDEKYEKTLEQDCLREFVGLEVDLVYVDFVQPYKK